MAWTYSGDPQNSPRDAVRFLVGDTDKNEQLLQDGEVSYLLARHNNAPLNAAIQCCEAIMARFARLVDENVGRVGMKYSQRVKQYTAMRDELRLRLAMTDTAPLAPSVTKSGKNVNRGDTDTVKPSFTVHEMENHQTSSPIPQNANTNSSFDQTGGD